MDPIDKMLQGDDTTSDSQSQTGQQADSIERIEQQSDEEVEFNKLSGSSQERVRELVRRARDAEERANTQSQYVPPAPQTLAPQQEQAIETLSKFGIATDEKVKAEIGQATNQIRWELEQARLMQTYNGADGLPKYDPTEVEDYVQKHPQYQYTPRDLVFKSVMYPDEFSGQQPAPKSRTQSFKPTRSNPQASPLNDVEALERRLAEPDGDEYYEANKDEINRIVKAHTQQFKGVNFGGQ